MSERPKRSWLDATIASALALLASANALHNQPALDDGWVIFENPLIKSLAHLPRLFVEPYNVAGASTVAGLFRPVTSVTYALNYAVGGANVVGYHLVNAAIHVACVLLVLALVRRAATHELALAAAALFAVHPAHVEAVTALVGRADELAALGVLSALVLVLGGEARWRLAIAWLAVALGVLSKESAAVAPLLLGLIGVLVPIPRRRLIIAVAVLASAVAVYPALKLLGPGALGVPEAAQWFGGQPRWTVALTMTRALAEYLRVLAWPHPLGVDFFYSKRVPMIAELGLAPILATVAWTLPLGLALALRKRAPIAALGVAWIFVALLPVLNIIPIGTLMAERLLYLPSVGFCVALAAILTRLPGLSRAWVIGGIVAALLALTLQRNAEWHDATTLWEAELAKEPDDVVVNNNLAVQYAARGDFARARDRLLVALRSSPGYWRAWVNLGNAQHKLGDDAAALDSLERARIFAPDASSPELFTAMVHCDRKEFPAALAAFTRAAQKGPSEAQVHVWYGRCLLDAGQPDAARAELSRAIELDPGDATSRQLIASHSGP